MGLKCFFKFEVERITSVIFLIAEFVFLRILKIACRQRSK